MPVDEAFKIRTLVKRINELSPAGKQYLLAKLAESQSPPTAQGE